MEDGIDTSNETFFNDTELIYFFKAHILSFIKYRTPGIFHAAPSHLLSIDMVQTRLLR